MGVSRASTPYLQQQSRGIQLFALFPSLCQGSQAQGSELIRWCELVLHSHWKGVSRVQGDANGHLPSCNEAVRVSIHHCPDGVRGFSGKLIIQPIQPSYYISMGAACSKRKTEQEQGSRKIILQMSRIEWKNHPQDQEPGKSQLGLTKTLNRDQYRNESEVGMIKNAKAAVIKMPRQALMNSFETNKNRNSQ